MRLLVTGASGLLGINLALEASREYEVFGSVHSHVIRSTAFTVLQADLTDPNAIERLVDRVQPEWVINCAALANLEACEAKPDLAKKLNTELPEKLALIVARGGARLVHVSTDAVFDGRRGSYTELDQVNPLSVYARSKVDGEQAVLEVDPQAIVARVNLIGWSLSGKRSLAEWFFNNLSAGSQVNGFTDVYFCPLLATDLASILLKMLARDMQGLFHVVSSDCVNKYDFGVEIARQFSFEPTLIEPVSVKEAQLGAVRSPNLSLDNGKLTKQLGETLPTVSQAIQGFHRQYVEGYPRFIRSLGG